MALDPMLLRPNKDSRAGFFQAGVGLSFKETCTET